MNQKLPDKTQASSVEKVRFTDGMIVTAEDLHDAMNYPVDVFRTLVRAFFGCGIVCGLEVKLPKLEVEECPDSYPVCITPGVAIDCHGYPVELCHAVTLEFPTVKNNCNPYSACIAIRRVTSEECPRPADLCPSNGTNSTSECTRLREQVQVKAFYSENGESELPPSLCQFEQKSKVETKDDPCAEKEDTVESVDTDSPECACLKTCEDPLCCEEVWVLLACFEVTENGIGEIDRKGRKYVKPIDCLCCGEKSLFGMQAEWREKFRGAKVVKKVSTKKRSPQQK